MFIQLLHCYESSINKASISKQVSREVKGMHMWLPNNLILFLNIIIIYLIGIGFMSIYNFIHRSHKELSILHLHNQMCRCNVWVCICTSRCVGLIVGQLMIKVWLDLDQGHCGFVTCIRLDLNLGPRCHMVSLNYLHHKSWV